MENLLSMAVKLSASGCLVLPHKKDKYGYVRLKRSGRDVYAHRLSHQIYKGPIPAGQCVCHTCDNPACINPNHLFLGTHAENMKDMADKGRRKGPLDSAGEMHGRHKLTERDVADIRQSTLSDLHLAKLYSVSRTSIYDARIRRTWSHV